MIQIRIKPLQIKPLQIKLTKGEYCQFDLISRINLLQEKGIFSIKKITDEIHEIKLFLLYDFYVEVYCNYRKNKILNIEPVKGKLWLSSFYLNMVNRFNYC